MSEVNASFWALFQHFDSAKIDPYYFAQMEEPLRIKKNEREQGGQHGQVADLVKAGISSNLFEDPLKSFSMNIS